VGRRQIDSWFDRRIDRYVDNKLDVASPSWSESTGRSTGSLDTSRECWNGVMATEDQTSGWRQPAARLLAATVIGIVTGLAVLALEHLVEDVLHEVFEAPVWVPAVVVFAGAVITAVVIRYLGGRKTESTEVYVEQFHHTDPDMDLGHAPGRLLGSFTTLASGAPLGLEGPAVYTGSAVATFIHRRWSVLRGDAFHALLVAGSAAGIAAVFKAPAAGAIFAMEVPFRGRFAGERLLPAIFGAASGYLTMALVDGVESEIEVPLIELTVGRAFLSGLLGLTIGIAAIGVIKLVTTAEHATSRWSAGVRALLAGGALAGIYALGRGMTGEPLALTSGNSVIDWAIKPDHAIWLLLGVFALRAVGPAVSIAGGGVGGLFIPLMAVGAVVGRLFADASSTDDVALFVVVGAATMLGAGYAVPLTGVVFVAEYTGQATVIVPALIAMAAARLVVGNRSVSPAQRP
jgi:CIC family chloride channel protein